MNAIVRKAAAIAILIGLLTSFYLMAIAPLIADWIVTEDRIHELSLLSARYRMLAGQLPVLQSQQAQMQQRAVAASGLLAGTNETLAAADLQNRLKTDVETAHGTLETTQILPTRQDGAFQRIGVRGEMAMTLPAVQQLLYTLEAGQPTLFLGDLSIRSHAANRQEDRNPDVVMLDVSFDVYGYLRSAQ